MKIKATIFGKRDYSFPNDKDGTQIEGTVYYAFRENNKAFSFSSKDPDKIVHEDAEQFNNAMAVEIDILQSLDEKKGKIKYSENRNNY